MKKRVYNVYVESGMFESDSRNAKKHLRDNGGNTCTITDKHGKIVTMAKRTENYIFSAWFEPGSYITK